MSVVWSEIAYQRLLDLMDAHLPDQAKMIYECASFITREVRLYHQVLGESRNPDQRIWFAGLLTVLYHLLPNGDVLILAVALNENEWPDGDG